MHHAGDDDVAPPASQREQELRGRAATRARAVVPLPLAGVGGGDTNPDDAAGPVSPTDGGVGSPLASSSPPSSSGWQRGVPPPRQRSPRSHSSSFHHPTHEDSPAASSSSSSFPSPASAAAAQAPPLPSASGGPGATGGPLEGPLLSSTDAWVEAVARPTITSSSGTAVTSGSRGDHHPDHHNHHQQQQLGGDELATAPGVVRAGGGGSDRGVKVVLEGALSKRGNNLLKDWRERWVEVVEVVDHASQHRAQGRTGQVRYYRSREEARGGGAGLGRVPLTGCTARPREGAAASFELVSPSGRVYAFRTRSEHERESWLDALRPYCTAGIVGSTSAASLRRTTHGGGGGDMEDEGDDEDDDAAGDECHPPRLATSPASVGAIVPQRNGHRGGEAEDPADDGHEEKGDEGSGRRRRTTRQSATSRGDGEKGPQPHGAPGTEGRKRLAIDASFKREGHLSKLGNNLRGDWRTRWFVLNTEYGTLDYYAHHGDDQPKGSIGLLTAAVSTVPNRKHCFSIVTSNRSYCVTADNEADMKGWMEAIQAAHSALLTHYQQELDGRVKKQVLIAGHLTKQGKNVLGDWRRRWCILRTDALHYYKSESDTSTHKEMGKIDMLVASVKQAPLLRRYAFEVITPNRTYRFQAASHEEMLEWIGRIREASESLLNALPLDPSSSSSSPSSPSSLVAGSSGGDAGLPALDTPVNRLRKGTRALSELLLLPANQFCADCDQSAPRWASVTLGVFVCIECSGIHRSLGVHLSRVRSVDLDTWDAPSTRAMVGMGNERAKEIWEHHVPPEWEPRKPAPPDNRTMKEAWIRAKYVDRMFARPDHAAAAASSVLPDDTPPAAASPRQGKEGWLTKQGSNRSWKKRWFVLREDGLHYYKSQSDETAAGVLSLSSAAVRPTVAARQPDHAFELLTKNRVYLLHADSEEDMEEWVALLARAASRSYHASPVFTSATAHQHHQQQQEEASSPASSGESPRGLVVHEE